MGYKKRVSSTLYALLMFEILKIYAHILVMQLKVIKINIYLIETKNSSSLIIKGMPIHDIIFHPSGYKPLNKLSRIRSF